MQQPKSDSKPAGADKGISRETLENLRSGDHHAFREVYLHYVDSVTEFLKMLTTSPEDAQEIAQDVFVALWENRHKIDPSNNIRGYIYTYARNAVFNFFKHRKVHDKYMQFASHAPLKYVDSEDIVIARETELLVRIAVERMPLQRRKVFTMSRFEGLSNDEIAEKLSISKHTVENHITTAVRTIRGVITLCALAFIAN